MKNKKSNTLGKYHKLKIIQIVVWFLAVISLLLTEGHSGYAQVPVADQSPYAFPLQRFGIAAPYDFLVDDLNYFNIKSVLDWRLDNPIQLPEDIEYIHVVRLGDDTFQQNYEDLDAAIALNPGETWLIGNEPDRYYYQDSITAEVYAARYVQAAMKIRALDPTAKLGFGTVVQPTPIRMRYLDRALDAMDLITGDRDQTLSLIDIWSIHAFILNEDPFEWGAGIPVGFYPYNPEDTFEPDYYDAVKITNFADTYSINILRSRIINFRYWLSQKGEQEKPLWITEYGSLFPPINWVPPFHPTISDELTSDYMLDSFDFLLQSRNESTGFIEDDFHLVQRWFWYSLNDHRYTFGGSLINIDPQIDPQNYQYVTYIGDNFKQYTDLLRRFTLHLPLVLK